MVEFVGSVLLDGVSFGVREREGRGGEGKRFRERNSAVVGSSSCDRVEVVAVVCRGAIAFCLAVVLCC